MNKLPDLASINFKASEAMSRTSDSIAKLQTFVAAPAVTGSQFVDSTRILKEEDQAVLDYENEQFDKLNAEKGLLSFSNLNSDNALIATGTNTLNFLGKASGTVLDGLRNLVSDTASDASVAQQAASPLAFTLANNKAKGLPLTAKEEAYLNEKVFDIDSGFFGSPVKTRAEMVEKSNKIIKDIEGRKDYFRNALSNNYASDLANQRIEQGIYELEGIKRGYEAKKASGDLVGGYVDQGKYLLEKIKLTAKSQSGDSIAGAFGDTAGYLLGGLGALAMLGDGLRVFNEGAVNAQKDNRTATIEGKDLAVAGAAALGYTGLNFASRAIELAAIKGGLPKVGLDTVASKLGEKGVLRRLPVDLVAKPVSNVALASTGEFITEAAQNELETRTARGNFNIDMGDNVVAGTMGAIVGGGMATAGSAVNVIKDVTKLGVVANLEEKIGKVNATPEEMVDLESENYDPARAINRVILKNKGKPLSEEDVATVVKAKEIVSTQVSSLNEILTEVTNPGTLQSKIDKNNAVLATIEANAAANGDPQLEAKRELVNKRNEAYASIIEKSKEYTPETINSELDKANETLKNVNEAYDKYKAIYDKDGVNNFTGSTVDSESIQGKVLKVYRAPSKEALPEIESLINNPEITPELANSLRSLSEAIVLENKAKNISGVNYNIAVGNKQYRSINSYMSAIAEAVESNDSQAIKANLTQLERFKTNMVVKAEFANQAQEIANQTKKQVQVIRGVDNASWQINNGKRLSDSELRVNGGFNINAKKADGSMPSGALVQAINDNASALTQAMNAAQQLINFQQVSLDDSIESELANLDNQAIPQDASNGPDVVSEAPVNPNVEAVQPDLKETDVIPPVDENIAVNANNAFSNVQDTGNNLDNVESIPESDTVDTVDNPEAVTTDEELSNNDVQDSLDTLDNVDNLQVKADDVEVIAKLALFDEVVENERQLPYEEQNLVRTGFKQVMSETGINSLLVSDPNALENLRNNPVETMEKVLLRKPTEAELNAVSDFLNKLDYFYELANDLYKPKAKKYRNESFIDFFEDGSGKLDKKAVAAIVLGVENYLTNYGTSGRTSNQDLAKSLGIKVKDLKNADFDRTYSKLASAGLLQNKVAGDIGKIAYQALQLKIGNVEDVRQSQVENALGLFGVGLMYKANLLETTLFTRKDLETVINLANLPFQQEGIVKEQQQEINNETGNEKNTVVKYIRVAFKDAERKEPLEIMKSLKALTKESDYVLRKLFSFNPSKLPVSLTPVEYDITKYNNYGSVVPYVIKKALTQQQAESYELNLPLIDVVNQFTKYSNTEIADDLFGFVDPETVIPYLREGVIGSNLQISTDIETMLETKELVNDQKFYLKNSLWVNLRSGVENEFNPQASKEHRAVAYMSREKIEVPADRTLYSEDGKTTVYANWLRSVGFAIEDFTVPGTARKGPADNLLKDYLPALDAYLFSEEVTAAVESYNRIQTGSSTKEDFAVVAKQVKKWKTGLTGLAALASIADMRVAMETGNPFNSVLASQSDGVNNGMGIIGTLTASLSTQMSSSIGVFTENMFDTVAEYRNQGGKDLYEQLSESMLESVLEQKKVNPDLGIIVDYFYPSYGSRSGSKAALIPFIYGAGFTAIARSEVNAVMKDIHKKINEIIAKGDQQEVDDFNRAIRVLTASNSIEMLTLNAETGFDFSYSDSFLAILESHIETALSGIAELSLTSMFGSYIKNKKTLTDMPNNIGYGAYKLIREELVTQLFNVKSEEHLTKKQKAELNSVFNSYMPSLPTMLGMESNSTMANIPLIKSDKEYSKDNSIKINFNGLADLNYTLVSNPTLTPKPFTTVKRKDGTYETKQKTGFSLSSTVNFNVITDVGSATVPLYTQAFDAYVTFMTMLKHRVQNYHDANAANANEINEVAVTQNTSFFKAMLEMNAGLDFAEAALKPFRILNNKEIKLDPKTIATLKELVKVKADGSLTKLIDKGTAIDTAKHLNAESWTSINQYGTEGGSMDATTKQANKLRKDAYNAYVVRAAALYKEASELDALLGLRKNKVITLLDQVTELQSGFKEPVIFAQYLKTVLSNYAKGNINKTSKGNYRARMYGEILNLVPKLLSKNTEINFFTVAESGESKSYMTYDKKTGKNTINYIIDSVEAPLNMEVIMHELVHAISVASIMSVRNNRTINFKATKALERLERLHEHVKNKTNNPTYIQKYALESLEEFVAVGLTDMDFIEYLQSIDDMPTAERNMEGMRSMFSRFIRNLFSLFYAYADKGKPSKEVTNAYESLVVDTAMLVDTYTKTKSKGKGKGKRYVYNSPSAKAKSTVSNFTAAEMYASLKGDGLSVDFTNKLNEVLANTADKLHSAANTSAFKLDGSYSAEAAWTHMLKNNMLNYVTKAKNAGYVLTDKEQAAIEALEMALPEAFKNNSIYGSFKEIQQNFFTAKAKVSVEDFHKGKWEQATEAEKALAKKKYDYVFKNESDDYLARFVAMTLGSQEFNQLMDVMVSSRILVKSDKPAFEKMVSAVNKAYDYLSNRITNTVAFNKVNSSTAALAKGLVSLELKNRNKSLNIIEDRYAAVENYVEDQVAKLKNGVYNLADRTKTTNKYTSLIRNTVKLSAKGDLFTVNDTILDVINSNNPGKTLGFFGELVNEMKDTTPGKDLAVRLLNQKKVQENHANSLRDATESVVLESYVDKGSYLTPEMKKAITYSLGRTDIQELTDMYNADDLIRLVTDRKFLESEVAKKETRIVNPDHKERSNMLAKYMMFGYGNNMLAKNAYAIANDFGMAQRSTATDAYVKEINEYTSLLALTYLSDQDRKAMQEIVKIEQGVNSKGNENTAAAVNSNGIVESIRMFKFMAASSKSLFKNQEHKMIKGYLPDITNPHKEIVIATNQDERNRYEEALYTKVNDIKHDSIFGINDVSTMYFSEDAGKQRIVSGAIALYSMDSKGTMVNLNPTTLQSIAKQAENEFRAKTPKGTKLSAASPKYDKAGNVVGYAYEMNHATRENFLERSNDFGKIIGAFNSIGFTKYADKDNNSDVIASMVEDAKQNMSKSPFDYVYVSSNSTDKAVLEAWNNLPDESKRLVKKLTGEYGMHVRKDSFITLFGFRKFSVTDSFDKLNENRNLVEKVFIEVMTFLMPNTARTKVAKAERLWQEAVRLFKDFIVIRNVTTLLGNVAANTILLTMHGVPLTKLASWTIESIRGGIQHRKNAAQIIKIEAKLNAGIGNRAELENELRILQNNENNNPMKWFIDQGLLAGIVEDVDPSDEQFTFKSKLQKKMDGYIDYIPKPVRTTANWLLVSPGTPLYQFLHSSTQYSDFSAKYVLFKHFTETAKEKLNTEEALKYANDVFINYDVPTSKGMAYLNDMGFLMFTKYVLRIQRALFRLIAKRPAAVIGHSIMHELAGVTVPSGIDPILFNNIGNPFRDGFLGLFGALDEPLPLKVLL